MKSEIIAINSSISNAYLLKTKTGFVLIDTGFSWQRGKLRKTLETAGCKPGDLKLVVITHADFDHTGNCAWLQKKFKVPIAIHRAESAVVERGRMLLSRKNRRGVFARLMVVVMGLFIFRRFKPDVYVGEGDDLARYGLGARIYHIPGHSMGSIGILVSGGDFFCGDLLTNEKKPDKSTLVDDAAEMDASIERLKSLDIKIIYPGHGRPFTMAEYTRHHPE
jgi:hydroxyacylglutathione hydrolase